MKRMAITATCIHKIEIVCKFNTLKINGFILTSYKNSGEFVSTITDFVNMHVFLSSSMYCID